MSRRPQLEPPHKVYRPISTIKDLARHLQWALSVELSTIPPYLCALYSVADPTEDAYGLVRSVVVEEMLHTMLVCNLMNSIGAPPSFGPDYIPTYPGYIPHHAAGGPFIQLQALSPALASTVFMAIELPEVSPRSPAEGNRFETIGQFYKAIEEGFERCVARFHHDGVFGRDTGFQRTDTYFGGGRGHLLRVRDLATAKQAITEITEQGEGAEWPRPPEPLEEPFGGFDHYGQRLDGTYGPILGVPWELSHYRKFQQLANGEVPIPDTYPMRPNPTAKSLPADIRPLGELFDECYTLVLMSLEKAFTSPDVPVNFFERAFPMMIDALPNLATLLMQTPLEPPADPTLGPNAGPSFLYRPRPLAEMVATSEHLLANPPDLGTAYRLLWAQYLEPVRDVLRAARSGGSGEKAGARAGRGGRRAGAPS
jgi:hypothetical protein